jgi:hypothetical protein
VLCWFLLTRVALALVGWIAPLQEQMAQQEDFRHRERAGSEESEPAETVGEGVREHHSKLELGEQAECATAGRARIRFGSASPAGKVANRCGDLEGVATAFSMGVCLSILARTARMQMRLGVPRN